MLNSVFKHFLTLVICVLMYIWFLHIVNIISTVKISPFPTSDTNKTLVDYHTSTISSFATRKQIQKTIQQAHSEFMAKRNTSMEFEYQYCGVIPFMTDHRNIKLKKLGEKAQALIDRSQNPGNCASAKYFVLPNGFSGEGSLIHRIAVALAISLNLNRVLLVNQTMFESSVPFLFVVGEYQNKIYFRKRKRTDFYKPLSNCIIPNYITKANIEAITDLNSTKQYLKLCRFPTKCVPEKFLDEIPAIPFEIAKELVVLHTRPNLWWNGQLVAYITRLNATLETEIKENMQKKHKLHFNVGLHVRRTDKMKVAEYQPLEKYMQSAEQYLHSARLHDTAHIYVASDDPTITGQLEERYPRHQFVNLPLVEDRYSSEGLYSLLADLYMLIHSDFVVCTLSSNICRYVYEMLQYLHGDATNCLQSLDTQYVIGLRLPQYRIAVQDYNLSIPINRTTQNHLNDGYVRNLVKKYFADYDPRLPFHRYPFSITQNSIQVNLVKKGDKILLIKLLRQVLNENEFGRNVRTNLTVCYPKSIAIDYITVR